MVKPKGLYVTETPFHYFSLPDRETRSDVVYGWSEQGVQAWLDSYLRTGSASAKLLQNLVIEKKVGASPSRLDAFDFIDWIARGASYQLDFGGQVEYEFSKKQIVRTSFGSYDFGTGDWTAKRDVVTGQFKFKGGRISGTVTSLMEGQYSSSPEGHDAYIRLYEASSPISVKSLRVIDGGDGPKESIFPLNSEIFEADQATLLSSYPTAQITEHPLGRFFFDGWYNDPFSGNLI